jgi:hypothetical protein
MAPSSWDSTIILKHRQLERERERERERKERERRERCYDVSAYYYMRERDRKEFYGTIDLGLHHHTETTAPKTSRLEGDYWASTGRSAREHSRDLIPICS